MTVDRPQWILGDVHAGTDPQADEDLLNALRRAAEAQVDLLIMGDLFVAWFGPPRFWPDRHRPILEQLRTIRARGGRVRFVVGNRDYLTESLAGDVFDEVYGGPTRISLGGQPTWVLHGDGIVPEDHAYRRWRALSRHPIVTAGLNRMPASWGRRLPEWTAARLSETNRRFKTGRLPESGLAAVAEAARRAGAVRCVMGHFHEAAQRYIAGISIHVMPGWAEYRAIVEALPTGEFRHRASTRL